MDQNIANYIKQMKGKGYNDESIKSELRNNGYDENTISSFFQTPQSAGSNKIPLLIISSVVIVLMIAGVVFFIMNNNLSSTTEASMKQDLDVEVANDQEETNEQIKSANNEEEINERVKEGVRNGLDYFLPDEITLKCCNLSFMDNESAIYMFLENNPGLVKEDKIKEFGMPNVNREMNFYGTYSKDNVDFPLVSIVVYDLEDPLVSSKKDFLTNSVKSVLDPIFETNDGFLIIIQIEGRSYTEKMIAEYKSYYGDKIEQVIRD